MKSFWSDITLAVATLGVAMGIGASSANAADWGPYQVEDRRSGYTYMTDESRAMQVDTFQNPALNYGPLLTAKRASHVRRATVMRRSP